MKKTIASLIMMLLLAMSIAVAQPQTMTTSGSQNGDLAREQLQTMNQTMIQEKIQDGTMNKGTLTQQGLLLSPKQGFGERLMNTFQQKNTIKLSEEAAFMGLFKMNRQVNYEVLPSGELIRQRTMMDYLFQNRVRTTVFP